MNDILLKIIILVPPILFALTFHEFSHCYIAYRLGDPTAKVLGRLTMNPLKHLDPLGTLAMFLVKFGWAKPVPVNPQFFKNPQRDMLWVAMAGPASNMLLALFCALLGRGVVLVSNFLPYRSVGAACVDPIHAMLSASVWINLVLAIFNFLPILPLDGGRIVASLLPAKMATPYVRFEKYGFLIILLLAISGILSKLMVPVISFATHMLIS
jgi:Zn-dependent protease